VPKRRKEGRREERGKRKEEKGRLHGEREDEDLTKRPLASWLDL